MTSGDPYLAIEVTETSAARTIALKGEADMASGAELKAAFADACASETELIVLDLKDLTFLDSSGLHAIASGHQLCRASGHELRIISGPAKVRRLFEITGMSELLSLDDAQA